jgi:hypothetical protein
MIIKYANATITLNGVTYTVQGNFTNGGDDIGSLSQANSLLLAIVDSNGDTVAGAIVEMPQPYDANATHTAMAAAFASMQAELATYFAGLASKPAADFGDQCNGYLEEWGLAVEPLGIGQQVTLTANPAKATT